MSSHRGARRLRGAGRDALRGTWRRRRNRDAFPCSRRACRDARAGWMQTTAEQTALRAAMHNPALSLWCPYVLREGLSSGTTGGCYSVEYSVQFESAETQGRCMAADTALFFHDDHRLSLRFPSLRPLSTYHSSYLLLFTLLQHRRPWNPDSTNPSAVRATGTSFMPSNPSTRQVPLRLRVLTHLRRLRAPARSLSFFIAAATKTTEALSPLC